VAPGIGPALLGKVPNTAAFAMLNHLLHRFALPGASDTTLSSAAAAACGTATPVAIVALAVAAWTGLQTFV